MESGLFHCHVDNVSRRKKDGGERSAVATAAYVSGTDLWNEREQKLTRFGARADVIHSELVAPDGAPDWARDRERLWNMVDLSAKRRDARLAKTIVVAFSREIPKEHWVAILQEFVQPYVAQGMVADAAIHDDGTGQNPHMHVLLTVSHLKPDGFGMKMTNVDQKAFVTQARTGWETVANKYLAATGAGVRLDRRSYKARGIDKKPTTHRGPNPIERRAKRERAARLRQEPDMTHRASADERRQYPLLTQRDDWPPTDRAIPSGMTYAEREEFLRYRSDREREAERAAEESFSERRIPEWYETKRDEAARRPLTRLEETVRSEPEAPGRYQDQSSPEKYDVAPRDDWRQPSLEDFERSPQDEEFSRERLRYEQDVYRRAVNMPRTPQETDLLKLAERASPDMRKRVEDELFERRLRRVRDADDTRRLKALEKRMGPELRERFEEHVRTEPDADRYPVPGPYWEAEAPSRLDAAQDDMAREYERDEDR